MAIYTIQDNFLAKIEAKGFQSFPTIIFSFQTVGYIQKARSKIMAAVRIAKKMPPYKYVVGINPNRLKYSHTYIESALAIAIVNSVYNILQKEKNYLIAGEIDINGNLIPLTTLEIQQILFITLQNPKIDQLIIPLGTILPNLPKTNLQIFTTSNIAEIIHTTLHFYKIPLYKNKTRLINTRDKQFFQPFINIASISSSTRFNTLIYQHNYSKYINLDSFIIKRSSILSPEKMLYLSEYKEHYTQLGIRLLQERPIFILYSNINQKLLQKILSHLAYGFLIINNRTKLTTTTYDTIYNFINQAQPYPINGLTKKFPNLQIICKQSYCKCGNLYSEKQCICNSKSLSIKPILNNHPLFTKFLITIDCLLIRKYQELDNLLKKTSSKQTKKNIFLDNINNKTDPFTKNNIKRLYFKLNKLYPFCSKENLLKTTLILSPNER